MNEIVQKRIKQICSDYVTELFLKDEPMGDFKDIVGKFEELGKKCMSSMWISVKEVLPELNEDVIVCFPDGSYVVACRKERIASEGIVIEWRNGDYTYDDAWVNYWMPIPKLKKDED